MMNWLDRLNVKLIIILFFVLCALPVGICTVLLTPVSQAPDEAAHVGRAASLLRGAIIATRHSDIDNITNKPEILSGVKVDTGLFQASFGALTEIGNRNVETKQNLDDLENERPDHQHEFASLPNITPYFPTAYIPAAIGFEIGILTKSSPLHCIIIGRFAMFAAFFAAGIAALWMTAYGEAFLLATLLLPMTLFLSGTINQDGVLIGLACLACAALTKAMVSVKQKWFGLICLVIFCLSKPPYLPLTAICLMPFLYPGIFRRVLDMVITALPVMLWVVFTGIFVLGPISRPPYHPGPLYLGNPSVLLDHTDSAGNLKILLTHPSLLISMPLAETRDWGVQHLREMIGILGQFQIGFGDGYYQIWGAAGLIALAGIVFSGTLAKINWLHATANFVFVLTMLIFTYWLISISCYIGWTSAGETSIDGLQGRYIVPLLPFLLFALPAGRGAKTIRQLSFAAPVIALGIYDIGLIPLKLVLYYYLH